MCEMSADPSHMGDDDRTRALVSDESETTHASEFLEGQQDFVGRVVHQEALLLVARGMCVHHATANSAERKYVAGFRN